MWCKKFRQFRLLSLVVLLNMSHLIASHDSNQGVSPQNIALQNLYAAEASLAVYNVYENFIVPQICKDSKNTHFKKERKSCALLPHIKTNNFIPLKSGQENILYKAPPNFTHVLDFSDSPSKVKEVPVGPKTYSLSYVGCYKREKIRYQNSDCSLFFMILESQQPGLAPIVSVKGTSNEEDWRNNRFFGAPILSDLVHILQELKELLMGNNNRPQGPSDAMSLVQEAHSIYDELGKHCGRVIFTGHSLGGALAQQLSREAHKALRKNPLDPSSGPTFQTITFNALSYTSMLNRLKKGLKNLSDPILKAGWKEEDRAQLEDYQSDFDGIHLSAINFHTADDILTQVINHGIIGKLVRVGDRSQAQAGKDLLLATDREIHTDSILSMKNGHKMKNVLYDMLFSTGGHYYAASLRSLSKGEQFSLLKRMALQKNQQKEYLQSPKHFRDRGIRTELFDEKTGLNIEYLKTYQAYHNTLKKVEHYEEDFPLSLIRFENDFGRFNPYQDLSPWLNKEFYYR